ncbi:MAG: hypothetical protein WCV91_03300 [Candidatus Margulisiibacteriota bacterium]
MTGCALLSQLGSQGIRAVQSPQPTPQPEELYFSCDSSAEAIAEIIKREKPDHLAFGEYHPSALPQGTQRITMLEYFVEQLLPGLLNFGFKQLVLEGVYSDSSVDTNISHYLQGTIDLSEIVGYFYPEDSVNVPGLTKTLRFALAQNMDPLRRFRVFGGGLKSRDPEVQLTYASGFVFLANPAKLTSLMQRVSQRMAEKVKLLRSTKGQSPRIITYGGAQHNDKAKVTKEKGISLWEYKLKPYTEVDLMPVEALRRTDLQGLYPEYKRWSNSLAVLPQKGKVTLVKRGESYTIIFPEGIFTP